MRGTGPAGIGVGWIEGVLSGADVGVVSDGDRQDVCPSIKIAMRSATKPARNAFLNPRDFEGIVFSKKTAGPREPKSPIPATDQAADF